MSDFITKTVATDTTAPDPTKHVNYVYGMVLGADDFNQEFAYLAGRVQWLARDLIGYGTVRGLQVKLEDDGANGPRVAVTPGVALSPRGQLICVDTEQCASLNAWLQANKPTGEEVKLYVTLSYRECLTDNVPIPGEPCRSEDLAMAASRRQDDFLLELRTQPPAQFEQDMRRDFVTWLRQIPLTPPDPGPATSLENFIKALRTAMHLEATLTPPDIVFGTPDDSLRIPLAEVSTFWRAAFRIWTTEIRPRQDGLGKFVKAVRRVLTEQIAQGDENARTPPEFADDLRQAAHLGDAALTSGYLDEGVLTKIRVAAALSADYWAAAFNVWNSELLPRWIAKGGECAWPPEEESVLLAELTVPLTGGMVNGAASDVGMDESQRPDVLDLHLLQDWLLSSPAGGGVAAPQTPRAASAAAMELTVDDSQGAGMPDPHVLQEWLLSTPTDVGTPGPPGPQGEPGKDGENGLPGKDGKDGLPGKDGRDGKDGLPGKDGKDGKNGKDGADGKDGKNGAPGKGTEDAVLHPPGLPAYWIVAAGMVRQKAARGPVYNDLQVIASQPGLIHLTFRGYKPPDAKRQYIIKALPVTERAEETEEREDSKLMPFNNLKAVPSLPTVSFRAFTEQGFVLQVMVQNKPVEIEKMEDMFFMVEVSQYAQDD